MADSFTESLRECLVEVRAVTDGERLGTGFFVAKDLILTCQHVVGSADPVEVRYGGCTAYASVQRLELNATADVVLLKTPAHAPPAPACARIGGIAVLKDAVLARGFPIRGAPHQEQVTGRIEDLEFQHPFEPWKSGARLIKFKDSQIEAGFSGAPLVHERTRRVIGVVTSTRGGESALGGVAVPTSLVLNSSETLREAQNAIDWEVTPWRDNPGVEDPFLTRYLSPRMPFFGRDATLRELDQWFESGPQRGLLVAPSGMGKSLLVARWFDRMRRSVRATGRDVRVQLVPISFFSYHVHREQVLRSLELAIASLRGEPSIAGDPELQSVDLVSAIRQGLGKHAPKGARLLLIIDALDEAVGWEINESLFPSEIGPGMSILLTARALADMDMQGWRKRLGWAEPVPVREFTLSRLTPVDLREAVMAWWSVSGERAEPYALRLWELTHGDVLVLGLYLDQYTSASLPAPERLDGSSQGLAGFFERWWRDEWSASGGRPFEQVTNRTLTILAGAFAPLSRRAVLAVLKRLGPFEGAQLDEALHRLRRFVIRSAEGYSIGHPELGRWWWERVSNDGEAEQFDAAFLSLAREMRMQRTDPEVERYLLRSLASHIRRLPRFCIEDVRMLVGDDWRVRHQASDGWPANYLASLDSADALCRQADLAALRQGSVCDGLASRLEIALRRASIDRLTSRISADMAVALVRHGAWSPRHALDHVLFAYGDDFPRVAAIGALAPMLDAHELTIAMEQLALEHGYAFNWDDSLGAWRVAAAATKSGIDHQQIRTWAAALPTVGAAVALLGYASTCPAGMRPVALAQALSAVNSESGTPSTLLALGARIGDSFCFEEVALALGANADAYGLAHALGFDERDPKLAAAALRVSWTWLSAEQRDVCFARILAASPPASELATDEFDLDLYDWNLGIGAIWDVCSVEQARQLFQRLWRADDETPSASRSQSVYTIALRYASRLQRIERGVEHSPSRSLRLAFGRGTRVPWVRAQFRAEASLPEWHASLVETILGMANDSNVRYVVRAVSSALSEDLLERLRFAAAEVPSHLRADFLSSVLAGLSMHGVDAAKTALQHAEQIDRGTEHRLLGFAIEAAQGRDSAQLRASGREVIHSLPPALRFEVLATLAPLLQPWTLDECEEWVGGLDTRSRVLSHLLPFMEPAQIDHSEAPRRLAIEPGMAHEPSVACVIRRMFRRHSLSGLYTWVRAMSEATGDEENEWLGLAIRSLADELGDQLVSDALSIKEVTARAVTCAALISHCTAATDRERLWSPVEAYLREAARLPLGRLIAIILRRLQPEQLTRAFEMLDLERKLLRRSTVTEEWLWVDSAISLIPWASRELIYEEFIPRGRVVTFRSGTDSDALRAALAPRLLELGCNDLAMLCARGLRAETCVRAHVSMLKHLQDPALTVPFARAILDSGAPVMSAFAIAREMRTLSSRMPREVAYHLCCNLIAGAESEARLFMLLTAFAAPISEWGGPNAWKHLAAAVEVT